MLHRVHLKLQDSDAKLISTLRKSVPEMEASDSLNCLVFFLVYP